MYSHQQARFTAGTIANDDELATDFGHGVEGDETIEKLEL